MPSFSGSTSANHLNVIDFPKTTLCILISSITFSPNEIEDIRMHRVVFGKSMTFRWFADVEPEREGITIKIQKSRKEVPQILQIKIGQVTEFKDIIKNAFETIN